MEFGIDKLKARFETQKTTIETGNTQTTQLVQGLQSLQQNNEQMRLKIMRLKQKQVGLLHALLTVMRKIEVLRCRGNPLQRSEGMHKAQLIKLGEQLVEPYQALQHIALQAVSTILYLIFISHLICF